MGNNWKGTMPVYTLLTLIRHLCNKALKLARFSGHCSHHFGTALITSLASVVLLGKAGSAGLGVELDAFIQTTFQVKVWFVDHIWTNCNPNQLPKGNVKQLQLQLLKAAITATATQPVVTGLKPLITNNIGYL
ncbi:hypothetical protein EDB86DRAFT_2824908 [Lactarius hatsudake]|nr:hypothetical protein EDB86DRAFT_2824908 [Lactarius hatsudake]